MLLPNLHRCQRRMPYRESPARPSQRIRPYSQCSQRCRMQHSSTHQQTSIDRWSRLHTQWQDLHHRPVHQLDMWCTPKNQTANTDQMNTRHSLHHLAEHGTTLVHTRCMLHLPSQQKIDLEDSRCKHSTQLHPDTVQLHRVRRTTVHLSTVR